MKPGNWRHTPRQLVQHTIAQAALGPQQDEKRLGNIALLQHQIDAVARIRKAIAEFGGALLADSVGMGKTYAALAVARNYPCAHILAPAGLLPMWRMAIANAGITHATLHSLHRLSTHPLQLQHHMEPCLVVVDEAHHLRTRNTNRFQNAARCITDRDVLLISATPLHNKPQELHNLLSLFLGNRTDILDQSTLAQIVIRRVHTDDHQEHIPQIIEHDLIAVPDNPLTLKHILELPPPLPSTGNVAASALVQLGLLRAWCSSDAALANTIRRRQLRGEALRHALTSNRQPTKHELQTWLLGDHTVQLGFNELIASVETEQTSTLRETLESHLNALRSLYASHSGTAQADAERAQQLRALLAQHAPTPIVAFSQFADTVRAMHRALSNVPGVASLTSRGGRIASGSISRHDVMTRFAPHAHGRTPPPPHQSVQLLITTDMLAEGVNLQDAAILVHLDLPWTDATRTQRIGRLARIGSQHDAVNVYAFAPPSGTQHILNIAATLAQKAELGHRFVGFGAIRQARSGESPAELATRLRGHWRSWYDDTAEMPPAMPNAMPLDGRPLVAAIDGIRNGFLMLVQIAARNRVIAGLADAAADGRIQVSEREAHVLGVIDAIDTQAAPLASGLMPACVPTDIAVERALSALEGWLAEESLHALTGPSRRTLAAVQRRALASLSRRVATLSPATRPLYSDAIQGAELCIGKARGVGAELRLEKWCAEWQSPLGQWLASIHDDVAPGSGRAENTANGSFVPVGAPPVAVRALLLIEAIAGGSSGPNLSA